MKHGLPEHVLQKIRAVFARYPQVTKAILYGSRAKGSHKNGSDIDLTLCGDAALTLDTLYRIANDLDDLLLPYTLDVSIFHHISDPDVIGHIQRVGMTLYEAGRSQSSAESAATPAGPPHPDSENPSRDIRLAHPAQTRRPRW